MTGTEVGLRCRWRGRAADRCAGGGVCAAAIFSAGDGQRAHASTTADFAPAVPIGHAAGIECTFVVAIHTAPGFDERGRAVEVPPPLIAASRHRHRLADGGYSGTSAGTVGSYAGTAAADLAAADVRPGSDVRRRSHRALRRGGLSRDDAGARGDEMTEAVVRHFTRRAGQRHAAAGAAHRRATCCELHPRWRAAVAAFEAEQAAVSASGETPTPRAWRGSKRGGWPARSRPASRSSSRSAASSRDSTPGWSTFPRMLDGRDVYLCWQFDEPRVEHWHELDGGFAGRQPLDPFHFPAAQS